MVSIQFLLFLEDPIIRFCNVIYAECFVSCVFVVPGMGNTSPKDMDALLPLMNMVIYSIDKVKKLRLNREVSRISVLWFVIVQPRDHSLVDSIFCY